MLKELTICLSLFTFIFIVGCAEEESPRSRRAGGMVKDEVTAPAILSREIIRPAPSLYMYRPLNRRDPFRALIAQREKVTVTATKPKPAQKLPEPVKRELDIRDLTLDGIIWDAENGVGIALLRNGENYGFILKEGRLLGRNQKRMEGIYGRVVGEEVRLVQDQAKVTLKIGESGIKNK